MIPNLLITNNQLMNPSLSLKRTSPENHPRTGHAAQLSPAPTMLLTELSSTHGEPKAVYFPKRLKKTEGMTQHLQE